MGMKNGSVEQIDTMTPRQERVAELKSKGWSLEKISREIGVSVPTVHRDLIRVREIWKARQSETYDEIVAEARVRFERYLEKLDPKIDGGSIAAIDTAIRAEDRFARLVGIDKPVETKVTISIEAVQARIAELEAKAAAPEIDYIEGEVIADVVDDGR